MNAVTTREPSARRMLADLEALAAFYALDRGVVSRLSADMGALLDDRVELTLSARGFEVLATGRGDEAAAALAGVARRQGTLPVVVEAFLACNAAFPGRPLGLGVGFGPGTGGPRLHHRTLAPKEDALVFLSTLRPIARAIPSLSRALEPSRMVHALAFTALHGDLGLEVSTGDDARPDPSGTRRRELVVHHVARNRASPEVRRTLAGVSWEAMARLGDPWPRIVDFARRRLGPAGPDVGVLESEGQTESARLHVRRTLGASQGPARPG